MSRPRLAEGSVTCALLGPTNTGKTHRAVERMLEHSSGMIGLPLRLLAREVYDRVSLRVGEQAVALVTGEEKRVPATPHYWVCTVEAMPEREVDFLAVDEIQLAADRQRGHVFCDRLLNARGRRETWFMGADTIRPLIEELVPTAGVRRHPRLSALSHSGSQKLSELPPRSAIVAFSMPRVYELAERIRARRGGAAVVLGALSPRARNAQVAMYQAGEVDYLVATDAIGMGLNLDIDHVAFSDISKFDGREQRLLSAAELAQIAGRAGRHENDGSFGALAPLAELPPQLARSIETHRFPALRQLRWRNHELDMGSLSSLVASLRRAPRSRSLRLARRADDQQALERLEADPEVSSRAQSPERVELLWQVCQIPDYRQLMLEDHVGLLKQVFIQLCTRRGRLDADWMARRIAHIDVPEGSIDDLLMRLAFIRTWTYISHRSSWVPDAAGWQQRTRDVEDRLSDALHQQLVARFVTRTASTVGARALRRGWRLEDSARVEAAASGSFAALAALRLEQNGVDSQRWLEQLLEAGHEEFELERGGAIRYQGRSLGRLTRGPDLPRPGVALTDPALSGRATRLRLERRLLAWVRDLASELLGPVEGLQQRELSPAVRGLAYLLRGGLGTVAVNEAGQLLRDLEAAGREQLRHCGVCFGRHHLYLRRGLKPAAVVRRIALSGVWWGIPVEQLEPRPADVSLAAEPGLPAELYAAIGFPRVGPRALRADVLERVSAWLLRASSGGPFRAGPELGRLCACPPGDLPALLETLGYTADGDGRWRRLRRARRGRRRRGRSPRDRPR